MLQCENSPAGEELFGGQFERVVPSLWLLLAFQNLFSFLTLSSVCRQRLHGTFQGYTDGHSGEGFLLCLHSFLPSSSPLLEKPPKMWCCALLLEITDLH